MENTQTPLFNRQNAKSCLVFIDPTVEDYQSLVAGVLPNTEVVILNAARDGVEQISEILAGRIRIASLHIISHGAPGRVYLGNTELGQHTLNHYASQLMHWTEALSIDAQILLYGCDVAQTQLGQAFVHRLSELTGATVLASENRTGSSALGGDWELEVKTANSTTELAFELATLAAYGAVLAQPYLVKDINSGSNSSSLNQLINVNNTLYFVADDGIHGYEVWQSDGTNSGTVLLKDISTYGEYSRPYDLTNVNDTLYFFAGNGLDFGLWKSNGTTFGTTEIKDNFGSYYGYSPLGELTNVNGTVYFIVKQGRTSIELWKSNGTTEGTVLVKDLSPYLGGLLASFFLSSIGPDSILYFTTSIENIENSLWKTDGTEEGTVLITDVNSFPLEQLSINDTVYFVTGGGIGSNNYKLWKSDSTLEGAVLLKNFYNSNTNYDYYEEPNFYLTDVNGILYFIADDGTSGTELWKSDGTTAGTVLVKDINSGSGSSNPANLISINNILYFIADNGINGTELWKSDGTTAGTVLVKDINSGSGSSEPSNLTNVDGILYFVATNSINGTELWKSDGTTAGTVLVEDINPGSSNSYPTDLTYINGILYFSADDGIHGKELWALNITSSVASPIVSLTAIDAEAAETNNNPAVFRISRTGDISTALTVKYIVSGTADNGSDYNQLTETITIAAGESFVDFNVTPVNDVYKEGTETVTLTLFTLSNYALDTSKRSATVTITDNASTAEVAQPYLVKDIRPGNYYDDNEYPIIIPSNLTEVNGKLYFTANDNIHGGELWKSDGTSEGTVLVKDINPEYDRYERYYSYPSNLISINSILYFTADDSINGTELWKSDGTENGTVLVKDIYPGSGSSSPSQLTDVNGILYFRANDSTHGYFELWKTDGTQAGTVLVKDIDISPDGSVINGNFSQLTNVNGTLYFTVSNNNKTQLWKSDGTQAGTVSLKDISASNLTNVNDTLYFADQTGLWKSDGTQAGTVLVKYVSFVSKFQDSTRLYIFDPDLTDVNGTLYFIANDGIHGAELWKSNGTESGTVLVKDINTGSGSSFSNLLDVYSNLNFTSNFTDVNGTLYFIADDGIHGAELWKSDGTEAGTVLVKDINTGSDSSFVDYNTYIYYTSNLTDVNGTLYFVADDGIHGAELWKSDGTSEGTVLVNDLKPGSGSSFVYYNDRIYYDIPPNLTYVNGILYFTADNGISGPELWALNTNPPSKSTVSITAIDANAVEIENDSARFRISRTGDINTALAIKYTVAGTANNGNDYDQITGIASLAVGESFVDITINPVADDFTENDETVNLTLATDNNYDIDTSQATATVTIFDQLSIINGNGSRDPLIGTTDSDRIVGGTGSKIITGGAGNDEFVYTSIREVGHRITDFTVGSDKIVLTQLLDSLVTGGYNGSDAIADGYVRLVQSSNINSTILQIDRDGLMGTAVFRPFIQLDNVTLQAMNDTSNFVF
ncbi:ELWxxDGT repeat protein [Halotia branconii]|uniref:DUF4347 domain-containing protein n=1 Tax=Halotia branconii CENA392 TaxID=1539056 RepID=A0AAJ6NRM3_9CYAN|nr:ELWxxDGT repeat protein [Halotia branconii]WGV25312.1 DUF4347 domain-containing protein [Halotia branconii CENA392]